MTHATAPTSTTTLYVHDINDHIIAEMNASGQTLREYIWLDDMPVAVVDNVLSGAPVIYFVHVDHLMRPARMTAQNTSWVWDVIYSPFGGVSYIWQNPATLDARFPGQWFQLESGLAYNWHRHYDATLGRYVQPDPIGFAGGQNLYGYARQSSLANVDPDGRNPVLAVGAICAEFPPLCAGIAAGAAGIVSQMVGKIPAAIVPGTSSTCEASDSPNGNDPCKGLRNQLRDHERKLREYIDNPMSMDNKGFLTAALAKGNDDLYNTIYTTRIASLQRQIANFRKQLEECEARSGR